MKHQLTTADMTAVVAANVIDVVIPAAGVGKRMAADKPKQYLLVNDLPILSHTVLRLSQLPYIRDIILAINPDDPYFRDLCSKAPFNQNNVRWVNGGKERADSVLAGLNSIEKKQNTWVLVHDAARPNITPSDVDKLVFECLNAGVGGILASPVKDTIKLAREEQHQQQVERTVPRTHLWHALTPQFFPLSQLQPALTQGLERGAAITDEASAIELVGEQVLLVEGRSDNIKVTQPEDLALIQFYLR